MSHPIRQVKSTCLDANGLQIAIWPALTFALGNQLHLKHHSYNKIVLACCVWFCLLHAAFTTAAAVSLVQNRFLLMNVYLK